MSRFFSSIIAFLFLFSSILPQPIQTQQQQATIAPQATASAAETLIPTDFPTETVMPTETELPTGEPTLPEPAVPTGSPTQPTDTATEVVTVTATASPTQETISVPTSLPTDTPAPTASVTPTATLTASVTPLPSSATLGLKTEPEQINPGEKFSLIWEIQGLPENTSLKGWKLNLALPKSFYPVTDDSNSQFDKKANVLTVIPTGLSGKLDLSAADERETSQYLETPPVLTVDLIKAKQVIIHAELSVGLRVGQRIGVDGGEASNQDGRFRVKFAGRVLSEPVDVLVHQPGPDDNPPPNLGRMVQFIARGATSRSSIHHFEKNLELIYTYDDQDGDPNYLIWRYWDETKKQWQGIPSTTDTANHQLIAETDHFSFFTVDTTQWQSAMVPPMDSALVSSFTGAATYSIPIDVPAGPGGATPSISLDYNSQVVDDASNQTNSGITGMGWSLTSGASISRNLNGTEQIDYDDTFALVVGNTSYSLAPVSYVSIPSTNQFTHGTFVNSSGNTQDIYINAYQDYKTTNENFWKVRRYRTPAYHPQEGYTKEYDYWVAWDGVGNKYTFDYRAYYLENFVDESTNRQVFRAWSYNMTVHRFPSGQSLTYTYWKDTTTKLYGPNSNRYPAGADITVYPSEIIYSNNHQSIKFVYDGTVRSDADNAWWDDQSNHVFYYRQALIKIQIYNDTTPIREYVLTYYPDSDAPIFPNANVKSDGTGKILALWKVQENDGQGNVLPEIRMAYHQDHMHLYRLNNSQGAVVIFTYDSPAQGATYQPFTTTGDNRGSGPSRSWSQPPDAPEWIAGLTTGYRPGKAYTMRCSGNGFAASNNNSFYVDPYTGSTAIGTRYTTYITNPPSSTDSGRYTVVLDPLAKGATFAIGGTGPSVTSCSAQPAVTRYRVRTKTIDYYGMSVQTQYTYDYGDAKLNDTTISYYASVPESLRLNSTPNTQFRGHGWTTETVSDGAASVTTTTYYYQDDVKAGRISSSVTTSGGVYLSTSGVSYDIVNDTPSLSTSFCAHKENQGCAADQEIIWLRTLSESKQSYEGGAQTGMQTLYQYVDSPDQGGHYGNATRVETAIYNGSGYTRYRATLTTYVPNDNSSTTIHPDSLIYFTRLPSFTVTYACPNGDCSSQYYHNTNLVSASCILYVPTSSLCYNQSDGGLVGVTPNWGMAAGKRVLLRFESGVPYYSDTVYGYGDGWGNLTQTTTYTGEGTASALASTGPQVTRQAFGEYYHSRLVSTTNAAGQTTTYAYTDNGARVGLPTSQTDANLNITSATYDGFGRIKSITRPTDTSPIVSVDYVDYDATNNIPHYIDVATRIDGSVVQHDIRYVNGVGHLIQEITRGVRLADGNLYDLVTSTQYDALQRVVQTDTQPVAVAQGTAYIANRTPANPTVTTYDAKGRVIRVHLPDGRETNTSYSIDSQRRLVTTVTDARSVSTVSYTDPLGRLVQTQPATGPGLTFTYNAANLLLQVTHQGQNTYLSYDLAGRKRTMSDPDMGQLFSGGSRSWVYDYDALGNLVKQTDANLNVICLYYDAINRLKGKTFNPTGGTCPGSPPSDPAPGDRTKITYDYDSGANGIGQRTSMKDASGTTNWTYDVRGRVTSQTWSMPAHGGPTLNMSFTYTSNDQIKTLTYPDGEVVTTNYNEQGLPATLTSNLGSSYVGNSTRPTATYDVLGRNLALPMGNNTILNRVYHAITDNSGGFGGQLQSIQLDQVGNSTPLFRMQYTSIDQNGNIWTVQDGNGATINYEYDSINRLTHAHMTGGYQLDYSFNGTTGLMNSVTDLNTAHVSSYNYSAEHPSAASQFDSANSYTYDANGNMTSRTENGVTYAQTWTPDNRLATVTWTVSGTTYRTAFVYDGDGNEFMRIERKTTGSTTTEYTTYYLGGLFEETDDTRTASTYGLFCQYYNYTGCQG